MNWLMDLAAPRTGTAAAVKGSIFMVLIHLLNFAVTVGIRGVPYSVEADLLSTTVIAVPFVAFIMSVLHKQQVLQDKLTHLASTDMLTGLPNRRAFLAHTTALARGGQSGAVSRGRANRGH